MSIDPRAMKALLQAQLAPSLDFGAMSKKAEGQSSNSGKTSLFDTILAAQFSGEQPMSEDNSAAVHAPIWSDVLWAKVTPYGDAGAHSASNGGGASHFEPGATPFGAMIQNAAIQFGVDPSLVQAVIATESSFNPLAQSHAGAKGLMQLMDGTARGLGVSDSFDPVQNVEGGTRYLAMLLRKYNGNEGVALAAYNAGPGRIDRLGISTDEQLQARLHELPKETQRYVEKVQAAKS